jgi:hypothetical protein
MNNTQLQKCGLALVKQLLMAQARGTFQQENKAYENLKSFCEQYGFETSRTIQDAVSLLKETDIALHSLGCL